MQPVNSEVALPNAAPTLSGVAYWTRALSQVLRFTLGEFGTRINAAITADGETPMTGPLKLSRHEAALLPVASEHEGAVIYVPDGAPGAKFRGSDGAVWLNLG